MCAVSFELHFVDVRNGIRNIDNIAAQHDAIRHSTRMQCQFGGHSIYSRPYNRSKSTHVLSTYRRHCFTLYAYTHHISGRFSQIPVNECVYVRPDLTIAETATVAGPYDNSIGNLRTHTYTRTCICAFVSDCVCV